MPSWLGSIGFLIVGGAGIWLQLRFWTINGVPIRHRRNGTARIERKTERAARKALASAVIGDVGELDAAVQAINKAGPEFADQVLDLVFAIGSASLRSIYHGDRPLDLQLRMLADDFAEYEDWSEIERGVLLHYLAALAAEIPREEVSYAEDVTSDNGPASSDGELVPDESERRPDGGPVAGAGKRMPDHVRPVLVVFVGYDPIFAACAIGGWLLSAFVPDEVEWTDFLDGILDGLESKRDD